jgi:threonine 3-dehydrogenase
MRRPFADAYRPILMATMRAVELYAPGKFRVRDDVPVPEPAAGEVRIHVEACGICGTDVHICSGDPSMAGIVAPPVILGHEFCGVVDRLGPGVTGLRPGDYVSAEMHEVCGKCPACRDGQMHACSNTRIRGVNLPGAFADYAVVSAGNVVRLPPSLPRKVGAILDPLGNAVHTTLKVPVENRTVAVVGYGPIGAMCTTIAAFCDARHVFVLDVSDAALERAAAWRTRQRLEDRVTIIDAREADLVGGMLEASAGGVDVALEISGHPRGINHALQITRAAGHVVHLGLPRDEQVTIEGFSKNFIFKGLTLHAVIGREMFATWNKMLDLLQRGLDVSDFVTAELELTQFAEGLERFGKGLEGKVVLYPRGVPARV